jgi:hypothetical protein
MADTTATKPTIDEAELNDAEELAEDETSPEGGAPVKLSVCPILVICDPNRSQSAKLTP